MLSMLKTRLAREEKGFTLIELLVVILIIGILAAIALPAFLNQRGKAQDTEAKSAARTAQTAMETYTGRPVGHARMESPEGILGTAPPAAPVPIADSGMLLTSTEALSLVKP